MSLEDSIFFFFTFYVASNTVKYFSDYFLECNQTQKKKKFIFSEIIYICKHFMVKNNLQRNKRSLNIFSFHLICGSHKLNSQKKSIIYVKKKKKGTFMYLENISIISGDFNGGELSNV